MRVGSLFTGIGGLDLGLERAGAEIAWQCEQDKAARRILARHWPTLPCYPDVCKLKGHDLAAIDVLVGGFPCQDVSIAGKRAGLAGERSGLFYEFARLADELSPTWLIIENVPGLLSSKDGRDMGTILGALGDLGYGWAYRLLDSRYFGVAQRRRRVYIIGCLGGRADRAAEVLFEREGGERHFAVRDGGGQTVGALTACGVGVSGADRRATDAGHIIPALTPRSGTALNNQQSRQPIVVPTVFNPYRSMRKDGSVVPGLKERPVTDALHVPTGNKESLYVSPEGLGVRRLTPLEWERLQGFPDGWTAGESDRARYRALGNAVTVPVAEWIARRLMRLEVQP